MILKKKISKPMNNVVFGKNIENVKKQEILSLSQQKGEISIQYQNQIMTPQSFFRTFVCNRKKKNWNSYQ